MQGGGKGGKGDRGEMGEVDSNYRDLWCKFTSTRWSLLVGYGDTIYIYQALDIYKNPKNS